MSEIKMFKVGGAEVEEVKPVLHAFDSQLQELIEKNSKKLLGVTFVANNYQIGKGKITTIGLDENRCPVVFVYSKEEEKNFLSKGLFYLEQILENKERFTTSVSSKLGKKAAESIDWSMPRIVSIASGYNKYDRSAVSQLSRNVALVQYNQYGDDIVMFELIESNVAEPLDEFIKVRNSFAANYKKARPEMKDFYERICEYVEYLGEAVTVNKCRHYTAFKKIKNFASCKVEENRVILNLNLEPAKYVTKSNAYRDVTFASKNGTGFVEYSFDDEDGYEEAKHLLLEAYNAN